MQIKIPYNPATNPLNSNEWSFPLLEIFHIVGFAVAVSTIFLVDLRMAGLGLRNRPSSQLSKDLEPWTLAGLAAALTSGPMIFTSDPQMYVNNPSFRFKMAALLTALIFHFTVHRKVALSDPSLGVGALMGLLSVSLWVSVVAGGIFIAFAS